LNEVLANKSKSQIIFGSRDVLLLRRQHGAVGKIHALARITLFHTKHKKQAAATLAACITRDSRLTVILY
jgi:hypothetical protein